jgi:hypothetical protein
MGQWAALNIDSMAPMSVAKLANTITLNNVEERQQQGYGQAGWVVGRGWMRLAPK